VGQTLGLRIDLQLSLISKSDTLQNFWDHVSQLGDRVNHSSDPRFIAICLMDYRNQCEAKGITPISLRELREALPYCKRHKLIDKSRVVKSPHRETTVRCWLFQKGAKS
jgi:hypothetical protein